MASIKSKGMKKAKHTLRSATNIAKALQTGAMSEEQYLYEYKLEYNKVQRRLRNLAKTPFFELAVSSAAGMGKRPLEYMQTFETKSLSIREKALALEEIRSWASHPFLSSKEWSEGTGTYSIKGRNYNYLSAQQHALHSLVVELKKYGDFSDHDKRILEDMKEPSDLDGYYKLPKRERVRMEKWKEAGILARYQLDKEAEEDGEKFSDVVSLFKTPEEGLKPKEIEELRKLKKEYAQRYMRLVKEKHRIISQRMEAQANVERRSNQYSRIRKQVKSV